uniref:ZNF598/HEL2 PAH domain-containing protein n=1 Tax=Globisporangium ultimum (strain ATCC 200006 / CBS 805.95 / DAOM BR144) TaxID=431595 RepID=K3WQ53_GLOUD
MASRPLPPGRRGRAPRTVSGLSHLPQAVILEAPSGTLSSSVSAAMETKPIVAESYAAVPPTPPPQEIAPEPVQEQPEPVVITPPEPPIAVALSTPHEVKQVHEEECTSARSVENVESVSDARSSWLHTSTATSASAAVKKQVEAVYAPVMQAASTTVEPAIVLKPAVPAATSPAPQAIPAVTPPAPAPVAQDMDLGEYHPFHLLLPVDAVPEVPEAIDCIYDDSAAEMQKNIMKVVKKLLGRDKAKLEDFKINSRLFGNNFMEAYEYLDSLVKEFSGVRALQLVPCLLMIQDDFMKRSALLLAARNYRMRNMATLETQCQQSRAAAAIPSPAPSSTPAPAHVAEPVVPPSPEIKQEHVPIPLATAVDKQETGSKAHSGAEERSNATTGALYKPTEGVAVSAIAPQKQEKSPLHIAAAADTVQVNVLVHSSGEPQNEIDTSITAPVPHVEGSAPDTEITEVVVDSEAVSAERDDEVQTSSAVNTVTSAASPALAVNLQVSTLNVAEETVTEVFSPVAVSEASASVVADAPMLATAAALSVTEKPVESVSHVISVQSNPSSAVSSATSTVPIESGSAHEMSSSNSFAEAESLFGERFSSSSMSDSAENLFGESFSSSSAPVANSSGSGSASPPAVATVFDPKPVHSQFLFGFASAGADSDSDSDDSGFESS